MKPLLLMMLTAAAIAAALSGCSNSGAAPTHHGDATPVAENGAKFKEGDGVSLTDEMKAAIGLKVADVTEEKIGAAITVNLSVFKPREASGWLTPEQAAQVKPGAEVDLQPEGKTAALKGTVQRVEQVPLGAFGDSELIIATEQPLAIGARLKATFHAPAVDAVPVIPQSALLKTAEGAFVYVVNGPFYVRTPVKTGAINDALVEIADGLYSGDQVVTTPVMSLWMAELQVLRAGKACTCGH